MRVGKRTGLLLGIGVLSLAGCGSSPGGQATAAEHNGASSSSSHAKTTVPNAVGLTVIQANNLMAQSNLLCRSQPKVSAETMGIVLSQQPSAGATVADYSSVTVTYAVQAGNPPIAPTVGCALAFKQVS